MDFYEVRFRTLGPNTPREEIGKTAVASIVLRSSGKFCVQTETSPLETGDTIVMDEIPVEDAQAIEVGLDSDDEEVRKRAQELLEKYVQPSTIESNVFFLKKKSYLERTVTNPSGRTRRLSTLITSAMVEEHFTGETPLFIPEKAKQS